MAYKKDIMKEIIMKCLEIDVMAVKVYEKFSGLALSAPLKKFFTTLQQDETQHVAYWKELLKLAQAGVILEVFEDSEKLLYDLTEVANTVNLVQKDSLESAVSDINDLLLRVIRMEYVLLHPSFVILFQFANVLPDQRTMEEEYTEHIDHICGALNTHSSENALFSLFSELLRRVWQETKRLVNLNQSDVLSGVLNRRGFFDHIRPLTFLAHRKGYVVAIMLLDIDNFKQVNDHYGHQAGDKVVQLVAQFIKKSVRNSDIVARYGGDEFIAFFIDVQKESLVGMAEKIRAGIEKQSKTLVPTTVSMGIAYEKVQDEPNLAIEQLTKEADAALYKAKQGGRNAFHIQALG
jgi:diguanylate cyclase (GGDEF)-like protein